MKAFLKAFGIGFVAVAVAAVVIALFLPSQWRVERTIEVDAPARLAFRYVGDVQRWPEWTTWNKQKDPTLSWSYSASTRGIGARQTWSGEELGNGYMEVTAYEPRRLVAYEMVLEDQGFPTHGAIKIEQLDLDRLRITWTDRGDVGGNLLARYLIPLMEEWIGTDMEAGLRELKLAAESDYAVQDAAGPRTTTTGPANRRPPGANPERRRLERAGDGRRGDERERPDAAQRRERWKAYAEQREAKGLPGDPTADREPDAQRERPRWAPQGKAPGPRRPDRAAGNGEDAGDGEARERRPFSGQARQELERLREEGDGDWRKAMEQRMAERARKRQEAAAEAGGAPAAGAERPDRGARAEAIERRLPAEARERLRQQQQELEARKRRRAERAAERQREEERREQGRKGLLPPGR